MKVILSLFCLLIIQSSIYAAPNIPRPVVSSDAKAGNDAVVVSENSKPRQQPVPKLGGQKVLSADEPKQSQLDLEQKTIASQQQIPSNSQQKVVQREGQSESEQRISQQQVEPQQKTLLDENVVQRNEHKEEDKVVPKTIPIEEQQRVDQRVESGLSQRPAEPQQRQQTDESVIEVKKLEDKTIQSQPQPIRLDAEQQKVEQPVVVQKLPVESALRSDAVQQRLDTQQSNEQRIASDVEQRRQEPEVKKDEKVVDAKTAQEVPEVKKPVEEEQRVEEPKKVVEVVVEQKKPELNIPAIDVVVAEQPAQVVVVQRQTEEIPVIVESKPVEADQIRPVVIPILPL